MIKKIFFLSVFFLFACGSADYSKIKVIEVIDGDTVKLANGQNLRYIGIDTPEVRIKRNGKFIYAPQDFALEAKEYNKTLVEGKTVNIEFDLEKKDRYGRLLGYCFVDGVFVNESLVKEGYALIYTYPPNVKYSDLLVKAQKAAREAKRGIWSSYEVISPEQANTHIGKVKVVRGRVLKAHKSDKCVFLNFGHDYKTDFTVVIFNRSLVHFRAKGIDPATFYEGKEIEVTGKIKEYNGPEIIADTPYSIEVVK